MACKYICIYFEISQQEVWWKPAPVSTLNLLCLALNHVTYS